MSSGSGASKFADRVAEFYDAHLPVSDELRPYFRRCLEFQIRPELKGRALKCLELGCGNGALSIVLATEYGFQATALDVSRVTVEAARENARRHGAHVRFVNADILSAELPLDTYDLIIGHFILHEVVGPDFERLAAFLAAHLVPDGYCTFLENSYFNPVFRLIRKSLPPERRVSHAHEYPFDPERFAALRKYFEFVTRDCPAVNLAERFYRQFWPQRVRSDRLYRSAARFDKLLTWALPARLRTWVSYFQVISFSQRPIEPCLHYESVVTAW